MPQKTSAAESTAMAMAILTSCRHLPFVPNHQHALCAYRNRLGCEDCDSATQWGYDGMAECSGCMGVGKERIICQHCLR